MERSRIAGRCSALLGHFPLNAPTMLLRFKFFTCFPVKMRFLLCMKIPDRNPIMVGADGCAHSFGFCFEVHMTEQAANKNCSLVLPDIHASQTIACMTQVAPVKTQI